MERYHVDANMYIVSSHKRQLKTDENPDPVCKFGWVSDADFICSGSGDASDWISFVGYEMRRTGEIRIRKDKIDEQFRHIAHKYYQVINVPPVLKEMIEHEGITDDARCKLEKRLEKFNSLAPQMEHFVEITHDRYTQAQGRHIDKYLKMKVHRAANKLKIDFPENITLFEVVM